jgi:insulysin
MKGYNCKQHVLLQKVIEKMTNLVIEEDRFLLLKESLHREYKNFQFEAPYQRALYNVNLIIEHTRWTIEEYLEAISFVTLEKIRAFIPRLLSQLFFEVLVIGNVARQEALKMMSDIENVLKPKGYISSAFQERRAVKLPKGKTVIYQQKVLDPEQINSALENYYQIGLRSIENDAILELFSQLVSSDCYSQLRTTEQLGYIVFSGMRSDCGVNGFRIILQSSVKDPVFLDQRVEAFLSSVKEMLVTLPDEEFANHVEALVTKKLEKDKNLKQEANRYWKEIVAPHTYIFDRDTKEAEFLKTLKKEQVIAFYEQFVSPESKVRRKLSSQVFGKNHQIPSKGKEPNESVIFIHDIRVFKRGAFLYPLLYTGDDRVKDPQVVTK